MKYSKSLEEVFYKYLPHKEMINKKNLMLYHYTSPEAAKSIVENGVIHCSNILFFWDKNEIAYAFNLLNKVILETECQLLFKQEIDKIIKEKFNYRYFKMLDKLYVASFSLDRDSLFMWNSYTNNHNRFGYMLGVSADEFIKPDFDYKSGSWSSAEIIYDEDKQIKLIKQLVNDYNSIDITLDNIESVMTNFSYSFTYFAVFIKESSYSSEHEYRVLFEPNIFVEYKDNPFKEFKEFDKLFSEWKMKLDYKIRDGVLVPYIAFPYNRNSIKEIMPSPYMLYNEAERGLKHYFSFIGAKIDIKKSSINSD